MELQINDFFIGLDEAIHWDAKTRLGDAGGYSRIYFEKIDLKGSAKLYRPFVIDISKKLFGPQIENLIRVPYQNLMEQFTRDPKYQSLDPSSELRTKGPFKKIILFCSDKTTNKEYTVIAFNLISWKVFERNGFEVGKLVEFSNTNNDILLIMKQGFIRSEGWGNLKNKVLAFLISKGIPKDEAATIADSIAGGLEAVEGAAKSLAGSAKAAQINTPGVVYDPGYPGKKGLTPKIQACLVRFAGGNDSGERSLKPYNLNTNAPGFSVWSAKFGDKGPVLKKKFDEYYDDKMLRVVLVLRDAINEYNREHLDLDNASAVEKMLNQIKDSKGSYIIYEPILDSPACKDTLNLQEGKNPMVKDFEFLSNKNKKIHSMLMEQVKKIKEDK